MAKKTSAKVHAEKGFGGIKVKGTGNTCNLAGRYEDNGKGTLVPM